MRSLEPSTAYTRRSENVAIGTFAEVVAGSDFPIEVFTKEGLKFPLSVFEVRLSVDVLILLNRHCGRHRRVCTGLGLTL